MAFMDVNLIWKWFGLELSFFFLTFFVEGFILSAS